MLAVATSLFCERHCMFRLTILAATVICFCLFITSLAMGDELKLQLRYLVATPETPPRLERRMREVTWPANEAAIIVCDVWDYHHCLNAVRRLEEFSPRLDAVLKAARERGVTIIHAPSDCMEAYAEHPARKRAISVPITTRMPEDIQHWCSRIPSEEPAVYPIDQSDGGEDDDPQEHAGWAAKLKALGRNPNMPWKQQSPLITIDEQRDYISDRGDEVWSILEAKGIQRVILTGVHTNMCVLGRPFGLRQMVRGGKQVVLMRDMTDCMYNPACWPYVDHFTGNDLVIAHVERYICPTITSEQLLDGKPFHFKADKRTQRDVVSLPRGQTGKNRGDWTVVQIPLATETPRQIEASDASAWLRCAVRLPKSWLEFGSLSLDIGKQPNATGVWLNGHAATRKEISSGAVYELPQAGVVPDDANLLVVRMAAAKGGLREAPVLTAGQQRLPLRGRWQLRIGEDASWSNIPLPARFGASPDILFEAPHVK
jgi:nicotinamidase-related amidase